MSLMRRDPRCFLKDVKATGEQPRSLLSGMTHPGVCVECLPGDVVSCGKMVRFESVFNG